MGRKANQSTLDAYNLIGKQREDGKIHTAYSAAKQVKANLRAVYKWVEKIRKETNATESRNKETA